jgi:hypothetical protein
MGFVSCLVNKKPRPWLVCASFLTVFLSFCIGRWGLWFYFPFPFLGEDGFKYLELSWEIQNGIPPSFHFIGAGYPLFIAFTQIFGDGLIPVMLGQQLLSVSVVLWLVYTFRNDHFSLFGATFFGVIYCTSSNVIRWESSLFPDSLITSGLLAFAILVYNTLMSPSRVYPLLLGCMAFFLISVRSSSIFVIPLVSLLAALLIWRNERTKGLVLLGAFGVSLLSMSTYNFIYSEEHQFNFLTYGRMSKTHSYSRDIGKNRIAVPRQKLKKQPLSDEDKVQVDSILRLLPDTSMLYHYFHSWNPHKYAKSLIHCRHPKYAQISGDSEFQVCHFEQAESPRGRSEVCYTLQAVGAEQAAHAVSILNRYDFNNHNWAKIRGFVTYHFNISYNHGLVYYGQLPYNYATTGSMKDVFIHHALKDTSLSNLMAYIFPVESRLTDKVGFDERYAAMIASLQFRIYDFFSVRILSILIQNSVWILFSILALIYALLGWYRNPHGAEFHVFLLALSGIALGSALIFSMISVPHPRYSSTTEFIYYLLPIMAFFHALRKLFLRRKAA